MGALARAAAEAGRLARGVAEGAARELSGALGKDQLRWPKGLLGVGPVIPGPYKQPEQGFTWHDGYMASCECGCVGGGSRAMASGPTKDQQQTALECWPRQPLGLPSPGEGSVAADACFLTTAVGCLEI